MGKRKRRRRQKLLEDHFQESHKATEESHSTEQIGDLLAKTFGNPLDQSSKEEAFGFCYFCIAPRWSFE